MQSSWNSMLYFPRFTTRTVSDFSTCTTLHQNAEREHFPFMYGSIWCRRRARVEASHRSRTVRFFIEC
eukprot:COSAG02_NODE_7537_length_2969_cov_24.612892_3_plen_68_part_00